MEKQTWMKADKNSSQRRASFRAVMQKRQTTEKEVAVRKFSYCRPGVQVRWEKKGGRQNLCAARCTTFVRPQDAGFALLTQTGKFRPRLTLDSACCCAALAGQAHNYRILPNPIHLWCSDMGLTRIPGGLLYCTVQYGHACGVPWGTLEYS
jgi:hypothetical protein